MKSMRKKSRILMFVVLLLSISIGYAFLYTDLKLSGIATINKQTWEVYFDNIQVTAGSKKPVSAATITPGNTTQVSYNVYLENPGDFYEFTVDVVNNGTMDAMITDIEYLLNNVEMSSTNKLPDYVKYIVTYADGVEIAENHKLEKATISGNTTTPTKQKYKIRVEFRSDITANDLIGISEVTANLKLKVTYGQATDAAILKPIWSLPYGKTVNNLSVGDELCVEDQCFNFIKYDGTNNEDVVMLAKYNLNVGNKAKGTETFLQDSDVIGKNNKGMTEYGIVQFSAINYWDNNGSPSSSYPGTYSTGPYPMIYDSTNYVTAPNFSTTCNTNNCWRTPGYSVAYYVEQYKTKLVNDYHATIKEARLLTYVEAADSSIGCDQSQQSCPTTGVSAFIANTSFWLGSAKYISGVWEIETVTNGNRFNSLHYQFDSGVRPVIVVTKSNIRAS